MGDLRIESVKLTEDFADNLGRLGVPAPWSWAEDPQDVGNIHARDGQYVCTLDTRDGLPASVILERAAAIVVAVNTCAGFRAVRKGG